MNLWRAIRLIVFAVRETICHPFSTSAIDLETLRAYVANEEPNCRNQRSKPVSEEFDRHKYVGDNLVSIDLECGSPFARCVLPADADLPAFTADLSAAIEQAFRSRCKAVQFSTHIFDEPRPLAHVAYEQVIKPPEVELAEFNECWSRPLRDPEPPEVAERRKHERIAELQRMSIADLAHESACSCGGTSDDDLIDAEIARRDAIWESLTPPAK